MEKRKCIFCGSPRSLTREHVIPSWLQAYVGGGETAEFTGVRSSYFGQPLDERRASGNAITLKKVCGTCNNGWMSQLETQFSEILPRLETDINPKRFNKADRAVVSSWILKTGIVAHLSSNYRQILPDDFATRISNGRTIPGGTKVFGGITANTDQIFWVQSNLSSITIRKSDLDKLDSRKHTFVFALQIKSIFIGFAWHGMDRRRYKITIPEEKAHQLYPHPSATRSLTPYDDVRQATMFVRLEPA